MSGDRGEDTEPEDGDLLQQDPGQQSRHPDVRAGFCTLLQAPMVRQRPGISTVLWMLALAEQLLQLPFDAYAFDVLVAFL